MDKETQKKRLTNFVIDSNSKLLKQANETKDVEVMFKKLHYILADGEQEVRKTS